MLGFKSKASLELTIAGYKFFSMLRKGQFDNTQGMKVFEQFYALAA